MACNETAMLPAGNAKERGIRPANGDATRNVEFKRQPEQSARVSFSYIAFLRPKTAVSYRN
jgi:hypothetical protein